MTDDDVDRDVDDSIDHGLDHGLDDDEELPQFRPPRQASPAQAILAIALLCAVCIAIGFVLGRTL